MGLFGQFQGLVALLLLGTTIGYNCNYYTDEEPGCWSPSAYDWEECSELGCCPQTVSCVEGDTTMKEVLVLISATSSGFMLQLSCMAFLKKGVSLLQRVHINVKCLYPWIVVHLAVAVLAALAAADAPYAGSGLYISSPDHDGGWMTFFTIVVVGVSLASLARVAVAILKTTEGPTAGGEPAGAPSAVVQTVDVYPPEVLAIAKTLVEASARKGAEW